MDNNKLIIQNHNNVNEGPNSRKEKYKNLLRH